MWTRRIWLRNDCWEHGNYIVGIVGGEELVAS